MYYGLQLDDVTGHNRYHLALYDPPLMEVAHLEYCYLSVPLLLQALHTLILMLVFLYDLFKHTYILIPCLNIK